MPGPGTIRLKRHLVTAEKLATSPELVLDVCFCGACNIVTEDGEVARNKSRDPLHLWAELTNHTYYEVQVHPDTHSRRYKYELDGPAELDAREKAKVRVYEINPRVPGVITFMEILEDARLGRTSIVWYNGDPEFNNPIFGNRIQMNENKVLREGMGKPQFALIQQIVGQLSLERRYVEDLTKECPNIIYIRGTDFRNVIEILHQLLK